MDGRGDAWMVGGMGGWYKRWVDEFMDGEIRKSVFF